MKVLVEVDDGVLWVGGEDSYPGRVATKEEYDELMKALRKAAQELRWSDDHVADHLQDA